MKNDRPSINDDATLRRLALQIAVQLPELESEARLVLAYVGEVVAFVGLRARENASNADVVPLKRGGRAVRV